MNIRIGRRERGREATRRRHLYRRMGVRLQARGLGDAGFYYIGLKPEQEEGVGFGVSVEKNFPTTIR